MKIALIIVTFYPTENVVKLVSLLQKDAHVFLIDNSEDSVEAISKIKLDFEENVTIIENKKNIGLAAAQNLGIQLGFEEGYDFFLFR